MRILIVSSIMICILPAWSWSQGQKHAIIIGVQKYHDNNIRDLKCAGNDAISFHTILTDKDTCNFPARNVNLFHTGQQKAFQLPTWENIDAELKVLPRRVQMNDTILVYFSGHGVIDPKSKKGYLILQDTKSNNIQATALPIETLVNRLKQVQAKHKLVILDCCQSGYGGKRLFIEPNNFVQPDPETLLKPFENARNANVVTLASCQANEYSYEWVLKKHGYFTHYLIEGLTAGFADSGGDGVVDSAELFSYVKDKVKHQVKKDRGESQVPALINSGGPQLPVIPLAIASFKPYSNDFTQEKNGLPPQAPASWIGTLKVMNGALIPSGSLVGKVKLPEIASRMWKDFRVELKFIMPAQARERIGLDLISDSGKPASIVVSTVASPKFRGVFVNNRKQPIRILPLKNKAENTLNILRVGNVWAIQLNGVDVVSGPLWTETVKSIQLSIQQTKKMRSSITSISLRPYKVKK